LHAEYFAGNKAQVLMKVPAKAQADQAIQSDLKAL